MTTKPSIDELKEQVAMSSRIIAVRGVTRGSFGHVSARIPGTDQILIKAKGPDQEALEFAEPKDVITIDIEGGVIEAPEGLQPPNETAMHLAVYRARPEVMSVIHSHPDWVVVLTACDLPIKTIYGAYDPTGMRMSAKGIPIYPRAVTIIDDELGEDFMRTMGDQDVCFLRGHGMTTAGRSVQDCTSRTLTARARADELPRLRGRRPQADRRRGHRGVRPAPVRRQPPPAWGEQHRRVVVLAVQSEAARPIPWLTRSAGARLSGARWSRWT